MQCLRPFSTVGLAGDFFASLPAELARHGLAREEGLAFLIGCREPVAAHALAPLRRAWPDLVDLSTMGGLVLVGAPAVQASLDWAPGRMPLFLVFSHAGTSPDGGELTACAAIGGVVDQLRFEDFNLAIDDADPELCLFRRELVRDLRWGQLPPTVDIAQRIRRLSVTRVEKLLKGLRTPPERYAIIQGTVASVQGTDYVCDAAGQVRDANGTHPLALTGQPPS
ncbi:MAG: hypothetical protein PVI30_08905 [Myxococcales bacterium]|jgi:hypothetical protein